MVTKDNTAFAHLQVAVERSWSRETSANPSNWSGNNPAYGQCAVTALIVQEFFGGKLLRVEATSPNERVSHYYNELPDGRTIDFTRRQFPNGTRFSPPEYRERGYVLSYPQTAAKYEMLWKRVLSRLGDS